MLVQRPILAGAPRGGALAVTGAPLGFVETGETLLTVPTEPAAVGKVAVVVDAGVVVRVAAAVAAAEETLVMAVAQVVEVTNKVVMVPEVAGGVTLAEAAAVAPHIGFSTSVQMQRVRKHSWEQVRRQAQKGDIIAVAEMAAMAVTHTVVHRVPPAADSFILLRAP